LTYGPETRALLIAKACTRPPETAEGARQERWTFEQLGAAVGMSGSRVRRATEAPPVLHPPTSPIRLIRPIAGALRVEVLLQPAL
jgi:hypothetical protein